MRVTGVSGAAFVVAGVVCALRMGTGCADVLGIESDRHLATTTVDSGNPGNNTYPAGWSCLGEPDFTDDGGTVTKVNVNFTLLDSTKATTSGAGGSPIAGVTIHACGAIDFSCSNAIATATTDDAGSAIFSLSYGFNGYYEVPSAPNFNPSLFFRPPQYVSQTQPQGMAETGDISAAGPVAGITQDPNLGFAIVSANDCNGNSAAGIVFTVGNATPQETVVYLSNSVPSTEATATDSQTGSALIFNVPVGTGTAPQSLSITASFASSGAVIQKIVGLARAGSVSYVAIEPDQSTRNAFME